MAGESKKSRYLIITKAFVELSLSYFFKERFAYWEFDLEGSTLEFARHYMRSRAKYWEFRGFDSSGDLPESAVDLVTPALIVIGGNLYTSILKILNFLARHLALNAILIFEEWSSGAKTAVEEFEEQNPTVILKEIFDTGDHKAFQVRDM